MKKKWVAVLLMGSVLTGMLTGCSVSGSSELLTSEIVQGGTEITPVVTEPVADEDAIWTFSYNMLKENLDETNPVLSPMSAYLAMGMVGLGAKGDTLAEFENTMGKDMQNTAGTLMKDLPTWLNDTREEKKSVLNVANAVWVAETMNPDEGWVKNVSDIYTAEAYRGVLSSAGVQKDINKWVEKKTNSLIKEFLSEPLDVETKMALFNTIYFYGEWVSEFEKNSTYLDEFTTADGQVEKVDMMHDERNEYYVKNEQMDGVVLDYRYSNMAFVALKPTAGQTVREMYEALTYEELSELLDNGSSELMKLKIPKFEVEFDKNLNETLQNMGIRKAFDERLADFTGLGYTENGVPLYISLVRQKAVVKLDEEGTEAAAATMVAMKECAMAMPEKQPMEVYFDEPFLYMIMDMESKTPLFMGVMDNPVDRMAAGKPENKSVEEPPQEKLPAIEVGAKQTEVNASEEACEFLKMIKVKDQVYISTDVVVNVLRCGVMDGQITSTVDKGVFPEENDQSNFGTGFGYQINSAVVDVYIDGEWIMFTPADREINIDREWESQKAIPLLTITSDKYTGVAYELFSSSMTWSEHGWLCACGLDPVTSLPDIAKNLPEFTLAEDFEIEMRENAVLQEIVIYDKDFQEWKRGASKADIQSLQYGKYYISYEVLEQGAYIAGEGKYETTEYSCIFGLTVSAEMKN